MSFIQHDQPVQTLSTNRADQPLQNVFACGQRTGVFSTVRPIAVNCAIDGRRIDAVAVVNEKSLRLIAGHNRTELLDGPSAVGCSVTFQCTIRRVPTSRTTKTYSVRNARRDSHEEVAGEHRHWHGCARRCSTAGTTRDRGVAHSVACSASPYAATRTGQA